MKHLRPLLLFLFMLPLYAQAGDNRHTVDSLRRLLPTLEGKARLETYHHIYSILDLSTPFEEELKLIKDFLAEAQAQRNVEYETTARSNELKHYYSENEYELFFEAYPESEQFLRKHNEWELLIACWGHKIKLYLFDDRYELALSEAEVMKQEVAKLNNPYLAGAVLAQIGMVYSLQGKDLQAHKILSEAISLMEEKLPTNDFSVIHESYEYLMTTCYHTDDPDFLQVIARYEKYADRYEAGSANSTIILFDCYIYYIKAHLQQNNLEKAIYYNSLCENLLPDVALMMKIEYMYAKSNLLSYQGLHSEAARVIEEVMEIDEENNGITSTATQPHLLSMKADYLAKARRFEEAYTDMRAAFDGMMKYKEIEFETGIADLRTRYEVDLLEAERLRVRNYFLFAMAGCLLLLVILLIVIGYQRRLRFKNQNLVQQIEAQTALNAEMRKMRHARLASIPTTTNIHPTPEASPASTPEAELFAQLEAYLHQTRAYTDPDFDRQKLITTLGTNQSYLYNAVNNITGMPLQEYINTLRLEEAKRMLGSESKTPINQVFVQCGFSTIRTFNRQFKEAYGMTPSEYRNTVANLSHQSLKI